MTQSSFSVRKLTPNIGAELDGVDLSIPLSAGVFAEIHDALLDNLVIFLRDQKLTPDQHKALGRRFGRLHIHPAPLGVLEGHPEIVVVKTDQNSRRIAGEHWHSDVSCDAEPPMGFDPLYQGGAAARRRHALRQYVRRIRSVVRLNAAISMRPHCYS